MKHRSKRFLSVLLSLVMVLGLMPGMRLKAQAASTPYLTFIGTDSFTITTDQESSDSWNGKIWYSTDASNWTEWDGTTIRSENNLLYLRGINTQITGGSNYWVISTSGTVACSGDIRTLLDYEDPEKSTMDSSCFKYLFYECAALTTAPELPATILENYCYNCMFKGCTSLTTVPELPATTLAPACYANMFEGCTALTEVPELPATGLAHSCYYCMFYGCTNIKVYESPTDDCKTAYRIPKSGIGTSADNALEYMFYETGGSVVTPTIGSTYYVKGTVPGHTHAFTYTASGATITATCSADDCPLDDGAGLHTATLTISAPTTDGGAAVLNADPADAFGDLSGSVKYQTKNGSTWTDETTSAPTTAGIHKASITLGSATASVSYGMNCITYAKGLTNGSVSGVTGATCGATVSPAITPAEGYQLDTFTVVPAADSGVSTVTVDGGTFVMPEANVTVSATFKPITYTVEVDGGTATVKDNTPEQHTYTAALANVPEDKTYDGSPLDLTAITVQKSAGFPEKVTVGAVVCKDQNDNTVTKAINVGTYTAFATVGDQTIRKSFAIHGRTPAVTYEETKKVDGFYLITKTTTDQYLPLESDPNGIVILWEGITYVARGNIEVGALVYVGDVKLVECEGATVTVDAGIYHVGSSLTVYSEEGAKNTVLEVKGNKDLTSLDNHSEFSSQDIKGVGSSLSGTIRINGGITTVAQGENADIAAEDIRLTLGAGVNAKISTDGGELEELTGSVENDDGSVTYNQSNLAGAANLYFEYILPATVSSAPTEKALTYTGSAQELVTAGTAEGGEMQYVLGTDATTAPTTGYTTSIPTATDAGTYYVWYKVVGDDNHTDTEAACVTVTIIPEEAHQHTFGTGDPRWAWTFVDGKCYANATYTCTCGETEVVSATVDGIESDDNTTITYTATDEYGKTDTRTYDASYTVTYKEIEETCKYGDTWSRSEDSAYDWMVNGVLRASGTKDFFFPVIGDATVTTTASSLAEQNALISVLSAEGGADKLTYVVSWSLPKGAKVKSTMIYRCRDDKAAITTADDLKAASNLRTYNMKMKVRNGQYTYTASGLTSGSSQTIMAEVVYTYKSETYTINTASGTEGPMHIGIGNA